MKQAISSIQLRSNVKLHLNRLREQPNETYEDIILRMIKILEKQKRMQKELLIEGCKEMAEENLKIEKEFSHADSELDWEW